MSDPRASVVIPSHNRAHRLGGLLDALAAQTVAERCEVLIVLDGSQDDSAAVVRRWSATASLPVRLLEQRQSGAGAARNHGVLEATGEIIVFLDDDVMPNPDLVERHLAHHVRKGVVVVGDYPVVPPEREELERRGGWRHQVLSWAWWQDFHHERASSQRPPTYRDLCAGNFSIRRDEFLAVGGFAADFTGYGNEDWELGYRLLSAGLEIVVEPKALAWHEQEHGLFEGVSQRRDEGRADVAMARLHPELTRGLQLSGSPGFGQPVRQAFHRPLRTWLGLLLRMALMAVADGLGLDGTWRRARDRAFTVSYWLGVASALGSWEAYRQLVESGPDPPSVVIDVSAGLPATIDLPVEVPGRLVLDWSGEPVGELVLPAWSSRESVDVAGRIVDAVGPELVVEIFDEVSLPARGPRGQLGRRSLSS